MSIGIENAFDDLPPDLGCLPTLRVWHALGVDRELGIGDGRPPIEVHAGDCRTADRRRRVSREEVPRRLAAGTRA
ncbi:DUF6233 domain-containing protein [Streptomyces sp. NPDC093982]|uniref:DUF6233 domain-containing protein n=1 Tax=Streptomyces sp. NPDC093982 TaxID=3155077 RepID=UPI00343B8702